MVERVIKALKDFGLRTYFGSHSLFEGEVKRVRFRNQRAFEALLEMGCFVETSEEETGSKNIPVILPEVNEDTVVRVEPKEAEPDIEAPPVIEPGKTGSVVIIGEEVLLDKASEPVGVETDEDLSQTDVPQTEEEIERATTEGMVDMGFEVQSVEEIPIEKQNKSKPEKRVLEDLNQTDEQVYPAEGIDPDKPDLPCPEKDHITVEEYLGKTTDDEVVEFIEEQGESKPKLKSDEVVSD